jgi:hypothetical protein
MDYKEASKRRKPFWGGTPAKNRKIGIFFPSWRGPEDERESDFVYHDEDIKNRNLPQRLALHFTLCAPNLFARRGDISKLCQYLVGTGCGRGQIARYKAKLQPLGYVYRPVSRLGKHPVGTGSQHAFIPHKTAGPSPLDQIHSVFKRQCSCPDDLDFSSLVAETATDPLFAGNYSFLKFLLSSDQDILDLMRDNSTITLMANRGSHIHLLTRPETYLRSKLMIFYYKCPQLFNNKLSTFSVYKTNLNNALGTSPTSSTTSSTTKLSYNNQQSFLISRTALALLDAAGVRTYTAGYYLTKPTTVVYGIFVRMCMSVLRSENPKLSYYTSLVTDRYGDLYALWLKNAFRAFMILIEKNLFCVGPGRPRKYAVSRDDFVAAPLVSRVASALKPMFRRLARKRRPDWKGIYLFLYKKIAELKRSALFRFSFSLGMYPILLRQSIDWLSRFNAVW